MLRPKPQAAVGLLYSDTYIAIQGQIQNLQI